MGKRFSSGGGGIGATYDSEHLARSSVLAAAAFTFAISIWSMHFIGILALRLPFALDYLVLPTLLSFLVCVFVVGDTATFTTDCCPVST